MRSGARGCASGLLLRGEPHQFVAVGVSVPAGRDREVVVFRTAWLSLDLDRHHCIQRDNGGVRAGVPAVVEGLGILYHDVGYQTD